MNNLYPLWKREDLLITHRRSLCQTFSFLEGWHVLDLCVHTQVASNVTPSKLCRYLSVSEPENKDLHNSYMPI